MMKYGKKGNMLFVDWIEYVVRAVAHSRVNLLLVAPAESGKSTILNSIKSPNVEFLVSGTALGITKLQKPIVVIPDISHLIRRKFQELALLLEPLENPKDNVKYTNYNASIEIPKLTVIAGLTDEDYEVLLRKAKTNRMFSALMSRFVIFRYEYTPFEKAKILSLTGTSDSVSGFTIKVDIKNYDIIHKFPLRMFLRIAQLFKENNIIRKYKQINKIFNYTLKVYENTDNAYEKALAITVAILCGNYITMTRYDFFYITSKIANLATDRISIYHQEPKQIIDNVIEIAKEELSKPQNLKEKEVERDEIRS